jgi:hypothetical protein
MNIQSPVAVVRRYTQTIQAEASVVEMIKLIPGLTVCKLNILLHDQREGCTADITYKLRPANVTAFLVERIRSSPPPMCVRHSMPTYNAAG